MDDNSRKCRCVELTIMALVLEYPVQLSQVARAEAVIVVEEDVDGLRRSRQSEDCASE